MVNQKLAKTLVTFAASYNASALIVFLIPGALPLFGVKVPYSSLWLVLPSLLALFGSIVLFLSSRNLDKFGAFPYWNGLIRILFAVVAILMDYWGSVGWFIGLIAIGDLIVGVLCILVLPKALNKTHRQLITNHLS